uniref:Uncharacterized protein n=1 Tax=Oryza meridionalis TaxID=40149 RepID=A0A0E0CGB4_9ORYZ
MVNLNSAFAAATGPPAQDPPQLLARGEEVHVNGNVEEDPNEHSSRDPGRNLLIPHLKDLVRRPHPSK